MPSKMLLPIVTLLLTIVIWKASAQCPDPVAILPCKCINGAVLCEAVTNLTDIKVLLSRQMQESFSLSVYFKGKAKLEKGILDEVKVHALFLNGNQVEFDDDAFIDMKNSLAVLRLTFRSLKSIPGAAISKLDKLERLGIDHSALKVFKSDVDLLPESLHSITFVNDRIRNIDSNAFVGLTKLASFYMTHCHLVNSTDLPKNFLPHERIKTVDMSFNELTKIPIEGFEKLNNAKVTLTRNEFTSLPKESLMKSFLDRGNSMILDGNEIKCGCDLKWIPQYRSEHFGHINLSGDCYEGGKIIGHLQDLNAASFKDC